MRPNIITGFAHVWRECANKCALHLAVLIYEMHVRSDQNHILAHQIGRGEGWWCLSHEQCVPTTLASKIIAAATGSVLLMGRIVDDTLGRYCHDTMCYGCGWEALDDMRVMVAEALDHRVAAVSTLFITLANRQTPSPSRWLSDLSVFRLKNPNN